MDSVCEYEPSAPFNDRKPEDNKSHAKQKSNDRRVFSTYISYLFIVSWKDLLQTLTGRCVFEIKAGM